MREKYRVVGPLAWPSVPTREVAAICARGGVPSLWGSGARGYGCGVVVGLIVGPVPRPALRLSGRIAARRVASGSDGG